MDILTETEISSINAKSKLIAKYNADTDSKSAYEILTEKLKIAAEESPAENSKPVKEEPSTLEKVANNSVVKSMMRTAGNTIVRSLLGSLGLGGSTRRRKKGLFF